MIFSSEGSSENFMTLVGALQGVTKIFLGSSSLQKSAVSCAISVVFVSSLMSHSAVCSKLANFFDTIYERKQRHVELSIPTLGGARSWKDTS